MAANDKPSALRSGSQVKSKPVGVRILDPTGDDKTAEPVSGSAESWALVTHRGDRECSTVWPARFSNVSVRAPFMGCGAIGSASVFGTEGCRFDSYHPSHFTDRSPFVLPFLIFLVRENEGGASLFLTRRYCLRVICIWSLTKCER